MYRIICYGDSNTFGFVPGGDPFRYPEDIVWTGVLKSLLGDEYDVINCGMCGRTTAFDREGAEDQNGLKTIEETLRDNAPCDMIIIMLGTNDTDYHLALSPKEIAYGMEKLVIKAGAVSEKLGLSPRIAVVCPPAIKEGITNSSFSFMANISSRERSLNLSGYYEKLAEKHGAAFVDCTDLDGVSDKDSMHLTPEGHRLLAEKIRDELFRA